MLKYDFRLETGDRNAGTVYLPDTPSRPLSVVIHCHGWGGSSRLSPVEPIVSLSKVLPTLPAVLVDFDFFGCGEEPILRTMKHSKPPRNRYGNFPAAAGASLLTPQI